MSNGFYGYWGKADPEAAAPGYHPLVFHCLDVAAVGDALLRARPAWLQAFADIAQLESEGLRENVSFMLAIHDLGKFGDGFQHLRSDLGTRLGRTPRSRANRPRHDTTGSLLWRQFTATNSLYDVPRAVLDFETTDGAAVRKRRARGAMLPWVAAVTGHHGRPPGTDLHPEGLVAEQFGQLEDPKAAWRDAAAFITDARSLFCESLVLRRRQNADEFDEDCLKASSWWLAGLTTLCDWVGSNRAWFEYDARPLPLAEYWAKAVEKAEIAIEAAGLTQRRARSFGGFPALFPGYEPSPLQTEATTIPLGEGPQLFLIEDLTGSGKTEAALTLVARLLDSDRADGFFFALPTMATANAMHVRVADVLARVFESSPAPSLVLAHSGPRLTPPAVGLGAGALETQRDGGYEDTASAVASAWLSDNRKKALLADVGVGTIDQALVGVLQARHSTLRLLGLHRHVLVVDEVHACDEYMNGLLAELLRVQAANGGSAVLLSATLPVRMRQQLVDAFRQGLGCSDKSPAADFYPLLVKADRQSVWSVPVAVAPDSERCVKVEFLSSRAAVVDWAVQKANDGRCVAWMRNTVRDALEAYDEVVERLGPARVQLFHARFPMGDRLAIEQDVVARFGKQGSLEGRRGRVVIATQVLEQSLDVDFDELVSDLAPIDRLIQRAGRLQRHAQWGDRGGRTLNVFAPDWTEEPDETWPGAGFRGTIAVYERPSTLWRTQRILVERRALRLPSEARTLVEAVYGPDYELPEVFDLATRELNADGNALRQRAMSRHNRIDLEQGYLRTGADWDDDEFVPTRLGDPTTTVRLVREEGGSLSPWGTGAAPQVAWRLGELSLRSALLPPRKLDEPLNARLTAIFAEPPPHIVPVVMRRVEEEWHGLLTGECSEKRVKVSTHIVFVPGRGVELRRE